MNRKIRSICRTAAFGSALSLVGVSAHALTNAIATGAWESGATWDAGVPTIGNSAIINGGRTVTLSSISDTDLIDLGTVAGETGTLEIAAGTDLYIANAVGPGDFPSSIRIGQGAGSTGILNMSGGQVFIDGAVPSGFGIGDLVVGDVGTGTLNLSGGEMSINHEAIIGLAPAANGTVNVSGGKLETIGQNILLGWEGTAAFNISGTGEVRSADWVFASFLPGSNATISQTAGTLHVNGGFVMGRRGNASYAHSGGTLTANTFVIADNIENPGNVQGATVTYDISGSATTTINFNTIIGAFAGGHGTVNQTGGTYNSGSIMVGRDGHGTWNISGGVLNQTGTDPGVVENNFFVGRVGFVDLPGSGQGAVNQTGGDVNIATNMFLGDFDQTYGEYRIAGGTLDVTGNVNIGAALASNAAPDDVRLEPTGPDDAQGQALNASGALIVRGSAGSISIGGNLLANPANKSDFRSDASGPNRSNSATLGFEILGSSGVSLVSVAGIADLDGAEIDLDLVGGYLPTVGATFDLITASTFGNTGGGTTENVGTGQDFTLASEDNGAFSLAVVSGGLGQILRATFLSAPMLAGDYNNDGIVNAADYTVWRDNLNSSVTLPNDTTPGSVTQADYDAWANNYGAGSASTSVTIPEPAACITVMLGSLAMLCRRNRG